MGFVDLFKSLKASGQPFSFSSDFSKSINQDTIALQAFQKEMQKRPNQNLNNAISKYLSNASIAAQNFAKDMRASGASISDFVRQQKMQERQ